MLVWNLRNVWRRLAVIVALPRARKRGVKHARAQADQADPSWALVDEHWANWGAARDGARVLLTRAQKYAIVLIVGVGVMLVVARPQLSLIVLLDFLAALYFVTGLHKVWLLLRGEAANSRREAAPPLRGGRVPMYTVLVPLYREGRIVPALVQRLQQIDYPPARLQVLLLVEADDQETLAAIEQQPLPRHIRHKLMPPGGPRTKPRALNVGLEDAQGEYIVIYDAEDQPERDQLRKAVGAFRRLPPDVVCLQARLIFYNAAQSVLTRMFTIDYTLWYQQFLPGLTKGLTRPGAFVPLGGTSNHFRVEELRRIGGWDPFNVTEDCDLGVRLGRLGLRVAMLDSATWEEAVPYPRIFVRQRSRWVKGYLQTYLVHMRHPLRLCKQLGVRAFIDFQLLVGASSLLLLVNPLMWMLTAAYMASKGTPAGTFIESLYPPAVYYPALLSLVVWNFIFFYCNAYVCVRHNFLDLTRYALLTPIYWLLLSAGAWMGLIGLIRNPHYWAKTEHGFGLPLSESSPVLAIPPSGQ
ncbi:MAG: glycosyltransferase XagB [Solirubrobacteraceae bacterium]|jgi:cellulose synthase/poly-beta-1,6-N-acetylglucosamine synthase-like glycosyltransferase|nr:glycosyltransferase XagB [Solirubrobacteraceae bacterium]